MSVLMLVLLAFAAATGLLLASGAGLDNSRALTQQAQAAAIASAAEAAADAVRLQAHSSSASATRLAWPSVPDYSTSPRLTELQQTAVPGHSVRFSLRCDTEGGAVFTPSSTAGCATGQQPTPRLWLVATEANALTASLVVEACRKFNSRHQTGSLRCTAATGLANGGNAVAPGPAMVVTLPGGGG